MARVRRKAKAGSPRRKRSAPPLPPLARPALRSGTSTRSARPRSRPKGASHPTTSQPSRTRVLRSARWISASQTASRRSSGAWACSRGLRCGPVGRVDRKHHLGIDLAVGGKALVDEIPILAPLHSEPLHQALARKIAERRDRHHARRREPTERQIERSDCRFLGIPLPPRILAQPPADLDLPCDMLGARRVQPLQSAEAEDLAVVASLDDPEGEAEVALVAPQPLKGGPPFLE